MNPTFDEARAWMVHRQLRKRDITDPNVLAAMSVTPRHLFVPEEMRGQAYEDHPLSIGHGQTISQPYIVALMSQLAEPGPQSRALDVGCGSGYQAAILAQLVAEVYSVEIVEELAEQAERRLERLEYHNVDVRCGDGFLGWEEHAPFDCILVAAAPAKIPPALIQQLAPGGRLVIPVGVERQFLTVVSKQIDGSVNKLQVAPVSFVPMTGPSSYS